MSSGKLSRLALVAAIAAPLLALCVEPRQDPATEDWSRHVKKACTSRRYGIRLAAARKVAGGGDEAVAAVEAYAAEQGLNALPASLVDAIADSGKAGPKVSRLLWSWTMNPDFYWRSSAMRGVALRVPRYKSAEEDGTPPGLPPAQVDYLMSVRAENDPAWLMRAHARLGMILGGKPIDEVFWLSEPDPRARVRLATLLLTSGVTPPMQPLVDALADERSFLGTPWGANLATESSKALRRWLGDQFPKFEAGDKRAAIAALLPVLEAKTGETLLAPERKRDLVTDAVGGVELLSCKHGDQFLQWGEDGTVSFGLDGGHSATLRGDAWSELFQDRAAIALEKSVGVVICDSLRISQAAPKTNAKAAPASLPPAAADWLKRLAQMLDDAGETQRAADLRRGLGQFDGR
ncbi:MAG: hypothetical protein VX044_11055 [Planctomycetota bacterium]|nr:hypothetical protein [Planctomycetota bacterium]MEC8652301.1 hypothetical protein [Planctomycetota bacterium]